jgi:hypothetical protein
MYPSFALLQLADGGDAVLSGLCPDEGARLETSHKLFSVPCIQVEEGKVLVSSTRSTSPVISLTSRRALTF